MIRKLTTYLAEKLIISKNFKSADDKLTIQKGIHVTGEEDYKFVIETVKSYCEQEYKYKVDKIFDEISCKSFEYCFYDESSDSQDDYERGIGKIFKQPIKNYTPIDFVNLDMDNDIKGDDFNSLSRFKTTDDRDVVLWITIDRDKKFMYVFISKK